MESSPDRSDPYSHNDAIAQQLKRLILHDADQYYAIQKGDEYYPVPETLTDEDLDDHLRGRRTLGIKLIQPQTQLVKAGALDLDAKSAEREDLETALGDARRIQAEAAALGVPAYIEFSGRRGWHVWVFSQKPIPAQTMRQFLALLAQRAGCAGAEVFPAGDRITEDGRAGPGSKPLKLPCGRHQASGNRANFVEETIRWDIEGRLPISSPRSQASLLETFQETAPEAILTALASSSPAPSPSASEERTPDLARLKGAEPACITWLRQNGAPLDQDYNAVNLTLARYTLSRGLGESAATLLAGEVAQATRPEHHTQKQEPSEKVRNFQSVLRSAQRDPDRYTFNCSYVRESRELKREACSGRNCPAWPWPGESAAPAPRPASPADRLAEREAIAFLIASHEEALPLALQHRIPPEAFLTLTGPEGEEPRHRNVWEAVLALAGREIRPSTILAEWERVQAAPVTGDQAAWLEALTASPPCSLSTFQDHLERLRETGNREVLAKRLREAEESNKQRDALPAVLDTLITAAQQIQRREASSLRPMEDLTGEILRDLFTRPQVSIETPSDWLNTLLTGGWLPGRLYVLGAPPGEGKTTFCAWAADYAAANGTPVLFVAYEMTRQQLYVYSLARAGEINSRLIEGQRWKEEGYKDAEPLAARIAEAARTYDETIAPRITILEAGPDITPAYLKGAIGQVRAQAGLEDSAPVLLVIDYLQCMNTGEEALDSGNNETQKISRLATGLKQLARDTGAAVIAISDITKQAYIDALKSGELNMGALRDSFKISHAADTVLLLTSKDTAQPPLGRDKTPQPPKSQLQLARDWARPGSRKLQALATVEINQPLDPRLGASYAMLSVLKNRGGRLDRPLFVYDKAYHRFAPIDLAGQAWDESEEEDNGDFT